MVCMQSRVEALGWWRIAGEESCMQDGEDCLLALGAIAYSHYYSRSRPSRSLTLFPTLTRQLASRTMADLASIQHSFFTASSYAVAGASNNKSKYGYILLDWYKSRDIPVTPVTPTSDEILGLKCISDVENLQDKRNTSLSIVTPPKVSKSILEQAAKERELAGLWLQPGAEDREVIEFIKSNDWLKERTVYGGPCVLVLGDKLRKDVAQGKL